MGNHIIRLKGGWGGWGGALFIKIKQHGLRCLSPHHQHICRCDRFHCGYAFPYYNELFKKFILNQSSELLGPVGISTRGFTYNCTDFLIVFFFFISIISIPIEQMKQSDLLCEEECSDDKVFIQMCIREKESLISGWQAYELIEFTSNLSFSGLLYKDRIIKRCQRQIGLLHKQQSRIY